MNLTILTRKPRTKLLDIVYVWQSAKSIVRRLTGKSRGPDAVCQSLQRGLSQLGVKYKLNPSMREISNNDTVGVLSDVNALKFAIELKGRGKIRNIVAGPNLVLTPLDHNRILMDENIDVVLVPSQWTKDFYSSFDPVFAKKIKIWFAGIEIPENSSDKKTRECLVYKKDISDGLYRQIINFLQANKIDFEVIKYGRYQRRDYLRKLDEFKYMIYLQESESQGIAMMEAWAHNVPTMAYNCEEIYHKGIKQKFFGRVCAPYLSKETGVLFDSFVDFQKKFQEFRSNLSQFNAYQYCKNNFSDIISARIYLDASKK